MSETETKKEEKNATTAKAQTVNIEADPPETGTNPPPKPHKKSNYVTLMPGQSEGQMIPVGYPGAERPIAIIPKHGMIYKLVDDKDVSEANTLYRPLGIQLVETQRFVYCDAPDKDAPPFVETHDPASPQGDMIANGLAPSGETIGTVLVGEGAKAVFVPAPFVTTPDGGIIPVAPQPGFTSADAPLVNAG